MSAMLPRADPYTVEIGAERIALPGPSDTGGDFEVVERTVTFECLSRGLITGTWRGIVVDELLERAAVPGETTHLVVTADDGHRVRLPIPEAIDALLALSRVDEAGTTHKAGMPRLVGRSLEGPRTVKNVARIEPIPVASSRNSVG
ncbi:sulfite oxidase-like oxidoreductase [Halobacteriales archaeon QS_5_68_33]|nr:MAG: sulfite oxidase-like oxidoreductase [Halobacteriales archaeon QS_5_68_33]